MSTVFKAKSRSGQTIVYCIAAGSRGRHAQRELKRDCDDRDIVEVSIDDIDFKATVNADRSSNDRPMLKVA